MSRNVHTHTHTHTRNDGQNDQSFNLLQCSLRSHLAEVIINPQPLNCLFHTIRTRSTSKQSDLHQNFSDSTLDYV